MNLRGAVPLQGEAYGETYEELPVLLPCGFQLDIFISPED